MRISDSGINFIIGYEGFSPIACKCVPTEKYLTIGYGHYSKDVKEGQKITREDAFKLLKNDLVSFEKKVDKYNHIYNFNQNQFDALVSFAYNVGSIDQLTAKGTRSIEKISECLLLYNKSGGKVLRGLTNRRKAEQLLFNKGGKEFFYPKYEGNSHHIDTVLKAIGVPDKYIGSWSSRKPVAIANGFNRYVGSMSDNVKIIALAKDGKLKKV